ncbi:glycosyltransferase [Andreprevotia chitinilytica]|uniref:glycosyltransferase n=1 Tax=Andreprevotia chitinilytica TaxID=396808 RepID=UPI00068F4070|nr:glycosyltransferase [Andreprevotia chitinilytica]
MLMDVINRAPVDPVARLIQKQKELGDRKILHFGSLAGWPHTVARVSRDMGIAAENVVHVYKDVLDLDRKLPYDASVFSHQDAFATQVKKTLRFLKECPQKYCLAHYHSTTLLHREYHFLFEGPYLKSQGVPMVLSLGGGDARLDGHALSLNKYYYKQPNFWHDLRIKLRWLSWSRNIAVCATDPELAVVAEDYFEKVEIFRQPVELARFMFSPPAAEKKVPLLLHVPTNPEIKGTKHIVEAVERLKKKGLEFEFQMVRQLTQEQFFDLLNTCDVYVDELRCGGHGMTAVEAMAMGKPTISYIREDLLSRYPADLPIVNANPDTIEVVLERLILNAQLRADIGFASRKYVEKYHDAHIVMRDMSVLYLHLLEKAG